jgi:putative flippase GtrA
MMVRPTRIVRSVSPGRLWQEARFAVRFACVGAFGVAINSACLYLLTEWGHVYYLLSSAAATEIAIVSNFLLNHSWTFAETTERGQGLRTILRFNLVALSGVLMTVTILALLTELTPLHYLAANLVAIAMTSAWNFIASRRWVWPGRARSSFNTEAHHA